MNLGIKGKVAVVAAASKGLGFAAALELAQEGAAVAICARRETELNQAADRIRTATGAQVAAVVVDLAAPNGPLKFIEAVKSSLGDPAILVVNNGGPPSTKHDTTSEQQWVDAFHLTFMSSVRLSHAVLPGMKNQRWGRIINITSVAVKQPIDGLILSNALRAGVIGFARTLANEVGPFGITVNNVCPGYTKTERLLELAKSKGPDNDPEAYFTQLSAHVPIGRIGEPSELAALIAFLASDRASYITGATIQVDGGFYRGLM